MSNKLKNLAFSVLQANILWANYLNAVSDPQHQSLTNWSNLDLISLVFLHLLTAAILYPLFSIIKSEKLRSLIPYFYAIGYLCYFAHISFFIVLAICAALYFLYCKTNITKIVNKYSNQSFSAMLALSIFFTCSQYLKVVSVKRYSHLSYYSKDKKTSQPISEKIKAKNIFFFVFDMLSYQELYLQNQLNKEVKTNKSDDFPTVVSNYPNFQKFSQDAWNFHTAFSPYQSTIRSIPIIIGLDQEESFESKTSQLGYKSYVMGSYINYCDLLPNLDYCKSYSWYDINLPFPAFITKMLMHLLYAPNSGKNFHKKLFFKKLYKYVQHKKTKSLQTDMAQDFFSLLPNIENAFVYSHFNIPHPPYIANKQGMKSDQEIFTMTFNKRDKSLSFGEYLRKNYLDSLDYADIFFGEILDSLKENGLYDDSLIIITADHSYRDGGPFKDMSMDYYGSKFMTELELEDSRKLLAKTHVPLMIKLPHQDHIKHSDIFISNSKILPSNNNISLLDETLSLSLDMPEESKKNLIRIPKEDNEFNSKEIKSEKLIIRDHKAH